MSSALEDRIVDLGDSRAPHSIKLEPRPRRIRVRLADAFVADSKSVMLMLEARRLPIYYFPMKDVRMDLLEPSEHRTQSPDKGEASYWSVKVDDRVAENAAWAYLDPPAEHAAIKDYVAFYWDKLDAWFEEDDEVFVHPRHPYHRVDVLNSSRHVRVVVAGETIAETRRPRLLFETGLPTRYYIPKLDVRMERLVPSDTRTACPYKGRATYWSVRVGDKLSKDHAWSYPMPIPECPKIENHICFFNEKVDELWVDGELMPVPITPWTPLHLRRGQGQER